MAKLKLQFGLQAAIPAKATAVWGARWIFPADMLSDRQDLAAVDNAAKDQLRKWLNGTTTRKGAIQKAQVTARTMAAAYRLDPGANELVELYRDTTGVIYGNTNASYGYLYVTGYLH